MRYAIYFAPKQGSPFAKAAATWLGRDCATGRAVHQAEMPKMSAHDFAALTASPRRYGFHATLKAPFQLAEGKNESDLRSALARFAATRHSFAVPRVQISSLDGFLAIVSAIQCDELAEFAGEVVSTFEPFRAPLSEADLQRRNPDRLSERQRHHLVEWGYPYVFADFRFHMTLTERLHSDLEGSVSDFARRHFADYLAHPLEIDALTLFAEPERGLPFVAIERFAFGQIATRTTA